MEKLDCKRLATAAFSFSIWIVKFKAFIQPFSEWVKGKTLDEAAQIKNSDIAEELALPPVKILDILMTVNYIKYDR
jgi:hypothetical protein